MFIEGKRKRKGIAYRIVKIYRYKVPSRNRTYNIIYKSTTNCWLEAFFGEASVMSIYQCLSNELYIEVLCKLVLRKFNDFLWLCHFKSCKETKEIFYYCAEKRKHCKMLCEGYSHSKPGQVKSSGET
jgi:hypothetical protein